MIVKCSLTQYEESKCSQLSNNDVIEYSFRVQTKGSLSLNKLDLVVTTKMGNPRKMWL